MLREEAGRQQPDVAVVAFYTGNDLQDVFGFYRERGAVVDLLGQFAKATTRSKRHVGKNIVKIGGDRRKVISAHPVAEIRFPIQPSWIRPDALLRFSIALRPDSWEQSDGVRFQISADHGGREIQLFDELLDPRREPASRGFNERQVDLSGVPAGASTLIFRTSGGETLDYDWAVWVEPHLYFQDAAGVLADDPLPSRLLMKPVFASYWKRVAAGKVGVGDRAWWEKRSSLFRLVSGRLDNLAVRWRLKSPKAVFSYHLISSFDTAMPETARVGLEMTARALREMQDLMAVRGGRVVLVLIPAKFQTEPETVSRFVERSGLDPSRIDVDQPHRVLGEACQRTGVTCVDMLSELRRRVAEGERVYFPEGHPNRLGHQVIARHLAEAITDLAQSPR